MEFEEIVEDQPHQVATTSLFLLHNRLSKWIITLFMFRSLTILFTSTVLMLSTLLVLIMFCKRKQKLVEKSVKQGSPEGDQGGSGSYQKIDHHHHHDHYLVKSPDVVSDQLSNTDDQDSEVDDWPFRDNDNNNMDHYSDDGSISDEDSLIEISLPGGHYVSHKQDCMQLQKLPDSNHIFHHRTLMELLAVFNDMNEEENLIEIDISMGSIKCSRIQIQA